MAADRRRRLPFPLAAGIVLGLWAPYTFLNTAFPGPVLTYSLGLVIAGSGLATLWGAGVPPHRCFVRLAPLSPSGALLLVLLSTFLPLALLVGRGQPFSWLDDLVYAPASAAGQELYFRAALLTTLLRLPASRRWAVPLHALLFSLWHLRAFQVAPPGEAAVAFLVVFVGGLLWGWQVGRDRTIVYATLQHALFLAVQ